MATYGGRSGGEVGLQALLDSSPAPRAHTSVAAEAALICGLGAALTAPFSLLFTVSGLLAVAALLFGLVGMVTIHRPDIAGSALNGFGAALGLLALGLLSVRYAGIDTAYGDAVVPWIVEHLQHWNTRFPQPG